MANEKMLIDANALMEDGWHLVKTGKSNAFLASMSLADVPPVDAVEVVRCKDCKHFIQEEHGCNHFGYYSHTPWVDEVDFCSYGERREGE